MDPQGSEMPQVSREHNQIVYPRGRGDCDILKTRLMGPSVIQDLTGHMCAT